MNIGQVQNELQELIEKAFEKVEKKVNKKTGGLKYDKAFAGFAIDDGAKSPFKINVYSEEFMDWVCVQYTFDLKETVEEFIEDGLYDEEMVEKAKKIRNAFLSLAKKLDRAIADA